jgi:hypothetical protein
VRELAQSFYRLSDATTKTIRSEQALSDEQKASIAARALKLTKREDRSIGAHLEVLTDKDEEGWWKAGYLAKFRKKGHDEYWGVYYHQERDEVRLGRYCKPDYENMEVVPFTKDGLFALIAQAQKTINREGVYGAPDTWESYLKTRNKAGYGLVGSIREYGERGWEWQIWYNHETGKRSIHKQWKS